ncbi:hypothetical protein DFQ26_008253 [Actinomortierella ambigua]|nr:hypothetical protein DFQ26_008253 [Actinomortierella ambigua]
MYSTNQPSIIVLGLALTAVFANAQGFAPPSPPTEACVTCLTTAGKTVSACANVPIPYPLSAETLLTLSPGQLACACALGTSLDWINTCSGTCDEPNLAQIRTTLTQARPLLCRGSSVSPSPTATATASTTASTRLTPPAKTNPPTSTTPPSPTPTKPPSSASMTTTSLAVSAAAVLLAVAHAFL